MAKIYHCTRLFEHEISAIEQTGLRPLDVALLEERVGNAQAAGLISDQVATRLLADHRCRESYRAGKIAFCLEKQLKDEDYVGWFLAHWGGDALFGGHIEDPICGPSLRVLGTPTIVEVEVPFMFTRIGVAIPPRDITHFHRLGEETFDRLTDCRTWRRFRLYDEAYMAQRWTRRGEGKDDVD